MEWYRVRVAGRPLKTTIGGQPRTLGFYVNRVVRAAGREAACQEALTLVAEEARKRATAEPLPRLGIDDVTPLPWWKGALSRQPGFVFFPLPEDEALVPDGASAESWLAYSDAKARLAGHLRRDATLQERGDARAIGEGYEELDGRLPRGRGPEWRKVFQAFNFWDYWIDARNHQWTPFYDIHEGDWPALARAIADDLDGDREISSHVVRELAS